MTTKYTDSWRRLPIFSRSKGDDKNEDRDGREKREHEILRTNKNPVERTKDANQSSQRSQGSRFKGKKSSERRGHSTKKAPTLIPFASGFSGGGVSKSKLRNTKVSILPDKVTPTIVEEVAKEKKEETTESTYVHQPCTHNVWGFVVNMHDAVNYDMDLHLTPDERTRYSSVINKEYEYVDIDPTSPLSIVQAMHVPGTVYRCRLRGVGVNMSGDTTPETSKGQRKNHRTKMAIQGRYIMLNILRLIESNGGWVQVSVSDIDVYRRLLVDITIPPLSSYTSSLTERSISSIILQYKDQGPFYRYTQEQAQENHTTTNKEGPPHES